MRNLNFLENILYGTINNINYNILDLDNHSKIQISPTGPELIRDRHTEIIKLNNYQEVVYIMIEYFGEVLQSYEKFTERDTNIGVVVYNTYIGGWRLKAYSVEIIKIKIGVITINNEDNLCLIRSIAVGNTINFNRPKLKTIKDSRKIEQLYTVMK